jgi:hypothetical protein
MTKSSNPSAVKGAVAAKRPIPSIPGDGRGSRFITRPGDTRRSQRKRKRRPEDRRIEIVEEKFAYALAVRRRRMTARASTLALNKVIDDGSSTNRGLVHTAKVNSGWISRSSLTANVYAET